MSVVVLLVIIASVVMMLVSSTNTDVVIDQQLAETAALNYAAESGVQHAIWTLNQGGCSDYADLSTGELGDVGYRATILPVSESRVTIVSEALRAGDSARRIRKDNVVLYDRSDLRILTVVSADKVKDAYLEGQDGHADHNKGDDKNIGVSAEPDKVLRSLIEFDLTELPDHVRVESAMLTLELNKFGFKDVIDVYRVTDSWTEMEVTWDSRDDSNEWNTPGGDYDGRSAGSLSANGVGFVELDMTSLVASWAAGTTENNGIILLSPESNGGRSNEFTSSDDTGGAVPRLRIVFSCECGADCSGLGTGAGAVAHWRLDEGDGTDAIESASGHDGVLENGPKWVAVGQLDGALAFDGLNDQIVVPHQEALSITEALTISAWVKSADNVFTGTHRILSKESPGKNDNYWLAIQGGALWLGIDDEQFVEGQFLNGNQWYHVAASFDSVTGEVRFFIDGVEGSTVSTTVNLDPNEEPVIIGSNWEQQKPWHGLLDDVRLYDRALSQEEVAEVMASTPVGGALVVADAYRDQFDSESYGGSDGSLEWSTDWQEINESDGSNRGDERVTDDDLNEFALRVQDNDNGGEGVLREVNLSACESSVFSFDYRRDRLDNSNDYVAVSVSDNGGSSWTELTRLSGPADDEFYQHFAVDISSYMDSESRIRFLTSENLGALDRLWIDNIDITCH